MNNFIGVSRVSGFMLWSLDWCQCLYHWLLLYRADYLYNFTACSCHEWTSERILSMQSNLSGIKNMFVMFIIDCRQHILSTCESLPIELTRLKRDVVRLWWKRLLHSFFDTFNISDENSLSYILTNGCSIRKLPGTLTTPAVGWGILCTRPNACTWGKSNTSAILLTRPQGTPTSFSFSIQCKLGCV